MENQDNRRAQGQPNRGGQGRPQGQPNRGSQGRPVQGQPVRGAQRRPVQGQPVRRNPEYQGSYGQPGGRPQGNPARGVQGQPVRRNPEYQDFYGQPGGRPQGNQNRGNQGRPQGSPAGRRVDSAPKNGGKKEKKKRSKGATVAIFALEFVALLVLLGVLYFVTRVTDDKGGVARVEIDEDDIIINEQIQELQSTTMKGYKTIALFGVDNITGTGVKENSANAKNFGKGNRTDTIMIASINQETGDIKLVSVYRDTYLNLSNDTYNKANNAYAKGGPEMAINMLNMNLDLNITDYVTVGFGGVMKTVDALGGVTVDVTSAEMPFIDDYQISIIGKPNGKNAAGQTSFTAKAGVDYTPIPKAGTQVLNGLQATAYCRVRYAATVNGTANDFGRAERQRLVLSQMLEKAKGASPAKLKDIAMGIMPYISTSLSVDEIVSLLGTVAKMNVTGSNGFPCEEHRATGTIGSKGSCVIPVDLKTNVTWLHEYLYGVSNYEPSSTVQQFSNKISGDVSSYKLQKQ